MKTKLEGGRRNDELSALLSKTVEETTDIEKIVLSMYRRGQITREGAELAAAELAHLRAVEVAVQNVLGGWRVAAAVMSHSRDERVNEYARAVSDCVNELAALIESEPS